MQAESGQLPSFRERLTSSTPAYASSTSITDYLNASRVPLLKEDSKTVLPQRVSSCSTGELLPIKDQPPGIPRAPVSEYKASDHNLRKTTRRYKPKIFKSRKVTGCNPALLVEKKVLVEMWARYSWYRDLMVKAKRHLRGEHSISKGNLAFTALRAGIRPESPRAAEIVVPRTKWGRVWRKMDKLREKWGLGLVRGHQKSKGTSPSVALPTKKGVAKSLEGLDDIAEAEDEGEADDEMENVLPSTEMGE